MYYAASIAEGEGIGKISVSRIEKETKALSALWLFRCGVAAKLLMGNGDKSPNQSGI